jgi:cytochrome P450
MQRTVSAGFAPHDPAFIANPYPVYAGLRDSGRIHYHEDTNQWIVPHHADVTTLLRDRRFGRTYHHLATHAEMGRPEDVEEAREFWHLIRNGILDMEPPDHTRVRRLVAKAFTPRMVEALRPKVQELMDGLVDRVQGAGEFDLIAELAEPLPVTVIAELLGIPDADRHHLRPWSAEICRMYELHPTEEDARAASAASVEFSEYLHGLIAERRARPTEDLVSELVHVVDEGDRLTEEEMIGRAFSC